MGVGAGAETVFLSESYSEWSTAQQGKASLSPRSEIQRAPNIFCTPLSTMMLCVFNHFAFQVFFSFLVLNR